MSMRVGGQTDISLVDNPLTVTPKSADSENKNTAELTTKSSAADRADLSNASSLVALAKAVPAEKQEKLTALAARVGSGHYKPVSRELSRALVQSLLKK